MRRSRDGGRDVDRLLRWYPASWRARYGDELARMVEDDLGGRRPPVRLRLSLVGAGLSERARAGGMVGDSVPPEDRVRAGASAVLVAWAGVVLAGAAFAKSSEHFLTVGAPSTLVTARAAYLVVAAAGVVGCALVAAGALVALPAAVRYLRAGGWPAVRATVARAAVATMVALVSIAPLAVWAHHLGPAARNGADGAYSGAFVAWSLAVAVSLGLWTAAGVAVARRLDLGTRVLRVEAVLAVGVAGAAGVVAVAVAVWWASMARIAPWYLGGTAPGTRPSPWTADLTVVGGLLAASIAVAVVGLARIGRTWPSLPVGVDGQ